MVQVEPTPEIVAGELYDDAIFTGSYTCPVDTDREYCSVCILQMNETQYLLNN